MNEAAPLPGATADRNPVPAQQLTRTPDVAKSSAKEFIAPLWRQPDGEPVSCREKIMVLNENLEEIRELAQDALEDAVLMGCDETQLRQVLGDLMASLVNPYAKDK